MSIAFPIGSKIVYTFLGDKSFENSYLTKSGTKHNMKLASCEVSFIFSYWKGGVRRMKTRIKELRLAANLTQQQLADLVRVSARTIISIEKEQYSPSLMLAYRLAQVFGTTVEELCCLEENKQLEDQQYEDL